MLDGTWGSARTVRSTPVRHERGHGETFGLFHVEHPSGRGRERRDRGPRAGLRHDREAPSCFCPGGAPGRGERGTLCRGKHVPRGTGTPGDGEPVPGRRGAVGRALARGGVFHVKRRHRRHPEPHLAAARGFRKGKGLCQGCGASAGWNQGVRECRSGAFRREHCSTWNVPAVGGIGPNRCTAGVSTNTSPLPLEAGQGEGLPRRGVPGCGPGRGTCG